MDLLVRKFYCLVFVFLLSGCSTPRQKQNQQISVLVHSERAAIQAGRFDKVKQLNDQLSKLVPPPKTKIPVHKFEVKVNRNSEGIFTANELSKTKTYIVLPEGFNDPVIVENSAAFNEALRNDKDLQKREAQTNTAIEKSEKKTDAILREKEKLLEKAEAQQSWWRKFWTRFGLLSIGGVGIVLSLILFPELIPLFFSIFKIFVTIIKSFIQLLLNIFKR